MMNDHENGPKISGAAIPLGSIFSNMMKNRNNDEQEEPSNSRKRVRVEKKKNQNKKKKFLDTYGTNLTNKAKNNELRFSYR